MAGQKKIGYKAWKERQEDSSSSLAFAGSLQGALVPGSHTYNPDDLTAFTQKALTIAIQHAGGDGFYDRKVVESSGMKAITGLIMEEFCQTFNVSQNPKSWPVEVQQVWTAFQTLASTDIIFRQTELSKQPWATRIKTFNAIGKKHGKAVRELVPW